MSNNLMMNYQTPSKTHFLRQLILTGLTALLLVLCFSAVASADTTPTIVTESAYDITDTGVVLDVCASSNGSDTTIDFSYGTSLTYGTDAPANSPISGQANTPDCVSAVVTGLTPSTIYYYEATATNTDGSVTSSNGTFQTTPGVLPVSDTTTGGSLSDMELTNSSSFAFLQPFGESTPTSTEVASEATVTQTLTISNFTADITDSSNVDGLTARLLVNGLASGQACQVTGSASCSDTQDTITVHDGDTLSVQFQDSGSGLSGIVGTDSISASFSYDQDNLDTPDITNAGVVSDTPTSAVIGADINSKGTDTLYKLEYGSTNQYGDVSPNVVRDLGTLSTANVTQSISNLTPGNTYHYAIVATNAGGTTTTQDATFTTPLTSPAVSITPASPLTFDSAVLGASVSAPQTVTITNTGTANLLFGANPADILNPTTTGVFAVTADTCANANVAVSGTCTLEVTFNPSTVGTQTATLHLTDNATGDQALALSGIVTAPAGNTPVNTPTTNTPVTNSPVNTGPVSNGPVSTGPGGPIGCPIPKATKVRVISTKVRKGVLTIKGVVAKASRKHAALVVAYSKTKVCPQAVKVRVRSVSLNRKTGKFTIKVKLGKGTKATGYSVSVK
jgi:hypothetical protein